MSGGVRVEGLKELISELRQLPEHLTEEARVIIRAHAEAAYHDIREAYPLWYGPPSYIEGRLVKPEHLRDAVEFNETRSERFTVAYQVLNISPLAQIFESGTAPRETGNFAERGSAPPGHVFIPRVIRHRRNMYHAIGDLLRRNGFIVTGVVSDD